MNKRFGRVGHKAKRKYPKGYDSSFEYDLHRTSLKGCIHHPKKLKYKVEHEYEVDFEHPDEPSIVIEVKGRFRDSKEAAKYVWVQKCNPDYEIIFVFQNPDLPMPHAKRRKDGSKFTHGEWATKNGFRFYSRHNVPEEWKK